MPRLQYRLNLWLLLAGWVLAVGSPGAAASEEGMSGMPLAREKRSYVVTGQEDFAGTRGFGADEPQVRMMNLMMVAGSGMEGMAMEVPGHVPPFGHPERGRETGVVNPSPFKLEFTLSPNPPRIGTNHLAFVLKDAESGKASTGLKLQAQVFMTEMDMGTEEPAVHETSPGRYEAALPFAMKGKWAVRIRSVPRSEQDHSRAWENTLTFEIGK